MLNFPKPDPNTGIGFHYFTDEQHYRTADLEQWLPELQAMGASWLILRGTATRAVPEPFIRGLIKAGIEPVIHIAAAPSQPVSLGDIEPLFSAYANWGVRYVVLYDQPNVRTQWAADLWNKPGLVNRFLELLTPALELAVSNGLVPVFPPLKQGGDYWDTSFLDSAIQALRQQKPDLLKQLTFAYYGFAFNHPINWGMGGHTRWPQARPYMTPVGSQDGRGFRAFEWYQDIIRARVGEERPLLMIAGGSRIGDADDPSFLPVDEIRHATCNIEIGTAIEQGQLPGYVMNVSYWMLSAPTDSPNATNAWFKADGTLLAVVNEFKKAIKGTPTPAESAPATGPILPTSVVPAKTVPHTAAPKSIYHYLLLPTFEWGVSDWHWAAAAQYIHTFQPTTGFNAQEAIAADYVTIVGNEQGISAEVEMTLRTAGCKVERVCGLDGNQTRTQLNEMAKAGVRFNFEESLQ